MAFEIIGLGPIGDNQYEQCNQPYPESRVPSVDSCCFIFSLKTGVKLIAFGELIICAALFIFTIVVGTYYKLSNEVPSKYYREMEGELLYLHYSTLLDVIFAIYLLIGIYKDRPKYAKVWCIVQAIHLFVSTAVIVYNLLLAEDFMPETAIENFISTCIDVYFILVVYSYYRSTKEYCRPMYPAV